MCDLCPPIRRPWKTIDQDALRAVCAHERLALKRPVHVRRGCDISPDTASSDGVYDVHESVCTGIHHIYVARNLTPEDANRTLLHELTHAAQQEKVDDPVLMDRLYREENRHRGYERNRFEVEANETADYLTEQFEVVR